MEPVPVERLVDLARLGAGGRPPTPSEIRAALPPGWVLGPDGRHARRDLRVLARDGWVLVLGLACFGAAGLGLFWRTFPRGWRGVGRFAALVGIVLVAGGLVAPGITRALQARRGRGRGPAGKPRSRTTVSEPGRLHPHDARPSEELE